MSSCIFCEISLTFSLLIFVERRYICWVRGKAQPNYSKFHSRNCLRCQIFVSYFVTSILFSFVIASNIECRIMRCSERKLKLTEESWIVGLFLCTQFVTLLVSYLKFFISSETWDSPEPKENVLNVFKCFLGFELLNHHRVIVVKVNGSSKLVSVQRKRRRTLHSR